MIFDNIKNFKNGWIIGNFVPSLLKTQHFEVSIQFHPKGFVGQKHFHKRSIEYNYVASGKMKICDKEVKTGDIFVFAPGEISESEFLEDTTLVIVRSPSDPTDKYLV